MDGQLLKLSDPSENRDIATASHPNSNTTSTKGNLDVGIWQLFQLYLEVGAKKCRYLAVIPNSFFRNLQHHNRNQETGTDAWSLKILWKRQGGYGC